METKESEPSSAERSPKSKESEDILRWVSTYSKEKYAKVLEETDKIMGKEDAILYRAGRHLIEAGGKLLRPSFVLFACEAVGGDPEKSLSVAASAEFAHVASLVHDDIIDGDGLRRGVPAVHVKFGVPLAILAGDLLIFKAFHSLAKAADTLGSDKVVRILDVYCRTSISMDHGEYLDIETSDNYGTTEEDYFDIVTKKTGRMFKCALEAGAIAGGGTEKEIKALSEYGSFFGVAFQMRDDVIGILGNPSETGKPASDLLRSRKTLMVIHGLQKADKEDRIELLRFLKGEEASEKEAEKAVGILMKYGAFKHTEVEIAKLVEKAKSRLSILKDTQAKKFLLRLADLLAKRPLTVLLH